MNMVAPNLELAVTAAWLLRSRGDSIQALRMAEAAPKEARSERVERVLKAAISAGSTAPGNWAEPLAALRTMSVAFLETLRPVSFAGLLASVWRRTPLQVRAVVNSAAVIATPTGEGQIKVVSALSLAEGALSPRKVVVLVALSDELAISGEAAGLAFINSELRTSAAAGLDAAVVGLLGIGLTPVTAADVTPAGVLEAFRLALARVSKGAQGRLVGACSPTTAAGLAALNANGVPVFPDLTYQGGIALGVPIVAITEVPDGELLIADGARVAGNLGQVDLAVSEQAALRLTDSIADPAASDVIQSLWQSNLVGLRGEIWWGAELLDPAAVVLVDGLDFATP